MDSLVSAIWFTSLFDFRRLDASHLAGGHALSGGWRLRQRLPVAGTISASTMHLSGAWTDEASANSCNPCDRVSRGHSVGFTQFAVTADRTPRIFATAVSSCGIGYPRPGLARTARPLTYPSRSLPKRELGVSPPRSDPRFGPSCGRIGVPTYETARCVANRESRLPYFTGSDRVNGSSGALCLTALRGAYRRVSQSRICTTV